MRKFIHFTCNKINLRGNTRLEREKESEMSILQPILHNVLLNVSTVNYCKNHIFNISLWCYDWFNNVRLKSNFHSIQMSYKTMYVCVYTDRIRLKNQLAKNTSNNNTFHIFTLFTTLPTSTLANVKIEQKSIVHSRIN